MFTATAWQFQSNDLSLSFLMSSADLHQVVFKWTHTEPSMVIVTGTFDEWASSIRLVKTPTGFEGMIQIPWEQKIKYKFIVDGEWLVHEDQPTEVDPGGYVNNVYTAPAKSIALPALETTNNHSTNGDSVVTALDGKIAGAGLKTSDTQTSGFPQLLSDLANTIAARDGTSSALAYVTSGFGAAMHSAVGVDPINMPKIAIPTPKSDDHFTLPPSMATMSPAMEGSAPELPSSPIAPLVPIMIVPVNAAENNTITSSPPLDSTHILSRLAPEPSMPAADMDAPVVVNALPVPEAVISESATADTDVAPISGVVPAVESQAPEDGPSSEPAVVNTPHLFDSVLKESPAADAEVTAVIDVIPFKSEAPTERTIESSPAPVIDTLPTSDTVIQENDSVEADAIPVKSEAPAKKFPEPSTRQPLEESSSMAVHEYQGQHEDSTSIRTLEPDLDVIPVFIIGSGETALVPSNEAIPPVPGRTSLDEVKPEDLSPESKEGSSDKKAAGDAVVETVVEPVPATIIEAPVNVAEPETKPVAQDYPVVNQPSAGNLPVLSETATTPTTANVEPLSTSSVPPTVAEVPVSSDLTPNLPAAAVEESTVDPEPVVAEVIQPTESNLSIEEKAQTPISVPEVKDVQTTAASPPSNEHATNIPKLGGFAEPSTIAPESHPVDAAAVTEREVAEPIPTPKPVVRTTPRKETPTTGSVKDIHEFPSSQTDSPSHTAGNSPSSSRFNSLRKKRISIFEKIKNIFHHDKEKEQK